MHHSTILKAQPIEAAAFAPYGHLIEATADGKPFDRDDAQLVLDRGIPRFYIMRLPQRGRQFHTISRHQHCTQCLAAVGDREWFLAVAPPTPDAHPDLARLQGFRIPGNCAVALHLGTWHAGPYFDGGVADFYNLELSDTNLSDRDTVNLRTQFSMEYCIGD